MTENNTPIEQLSSEERAQLAAWFHSWNDDEWDERMKRDIAKFTLLCAKWTMTSKRCAFEICREIQNASAVLGSLRQPVAVNTIR
jgi:hypothetical protein